VLAVTGVLQCATAVPLREVLFVAPVYRIPTPSMLLFGEFLHFV
jgi:hypothetical protein